MHLTVKKIIRNDYAYAEPRIVAVHLFSQDVTDEKGNVTEPARHVATLHNMTSEDCPFEGDTLDCGFAPVKKERDPKAEREQRVKANLAAEAEIAPLK